MPTLQDLQYFQAMPLRMKMDLSRNRIREWVNRFGEDGCYISFSGGKDSTVLLDLVRNYCGYKRVKAMFVDVPTQFPELKEFVQTFDNVDIVKPKMSFAQVCQKYGFPMLSKEIAESVEGARKYLTSLMDELENPDRQTDRQTDLMRNSIVNSQGKENTVNFQKPSLKSTKSPSKEIQGGVR